MPDQTAFKVRLTDAYARYTAAAPTAVDSRAVAATVAAGHVRHPSGWRAVFGPGRRIAALVALGLVLLSLVVGAAFVGSQVTPHPPVLPTAAPAVVPTAVAPTALRSDLPGYRGIFGAAPDLKIGRMDATVVALNDGRILILAGEGGSPAEVLNPATGKSTTIDLDAPTGGSGSGVLLPDGRVFLIIYDDNQTAAHAYLFDPAAMSFHVVAQQGLANAPVFGVSPTIALLHDGRVLVSGGKADVYRTDLLATAQLFDPATGTFTPTGSMAAPRWRHSMTTLSDGRVLVAGGEGTVERSQLGSNRRPPVYRSDAEIYDPKTGTFTLTGAMELVRGATLAVRLPDGRVVVVPHFGLFGIYRLLDGVPAPHDPSSPVPVEIFDPTTGTFVADGTAPGMAASATLLRSGRILLTGTVGTPASGEALGTWSVIYDPVTGRAETTASPRAWFGAAAALADGRVLFAGGVLPDPKGGWPPDLGRWVEIFE